MVAQLRRSAALSEAAAAADVEERERERDLLIIRMNKERERFSRAPSAGSFSRAESAGGSGAASAARVAEEEVRAQRDFRSKRGAVREKVEAAKSEVEVEEVEERDASVGRGRSSRRGGGGGGRDDGGSGGGGGGGGGGSQGEAGRSADDREKMERSSKATSRGKSHSRKGK